MSTVMANSKVTSVDLTTSVINSISNNSLAKRFSATQITNWFLNKASSMLHASLLAKTEPKYSDLR